MTRPEDTVRTGLRYWDLYGAKESDEVQRARDALDELVAERDRLAAELEQLALEHATEWMALEAECDRLREDLIFQTRENQDRERRRLALLDERDRLAAALGELKRHDADSTDPRQKLPSWAIRVVDEALAADGGDA